MESTLDDDCKVIEAGPAEPSTPGRCHGRCHKHVEQLPWLQYPDGEEQWFGQARMASEWMALFFDLVVVAILAVFGGTHELTSPKAIPNFVGYYAVIVCMWTSQIHLDVRYETHDVVNRVFKCLHVILFVYIGSASGGWDLDTLTHVRKVEVNPVQRVRRQLASTSFLTIGLAFLLHRVLLATQYLIVVYLGMRTRRAVGAPLGSALILLGSASIVAIGIGLPSDSSAEVIGKISLMYLSIVVEVGCTLGLARTRFRTAYPSHFLAERYGGLTLIILGEGFINVSRAFQSAMTGASEKDKTLYANVFLVICIFFYIWTLLFSSFAVSDKVRRVNGWAWEAIHWPLHLSLLLFLAAMINVVMVSSFTNGVSDVLGKITDVFTPEGFTPQRLESVGDYIDRLGPIPPFREWYNMTRALYASDDDTNQTRAVVSLAEYLTTAVVVGANKAKIEIPPEAAHAYDDLETIAIPVIYDDLTESNSSLADPSLQGNATAHGNSTAQGNSTSHHRERSTTPAHGSSESRDDEVIKEVWELAGEVIGEIFNDAYSGVRWLFPTAGITMMLIAARSLLRYRFKGPPHYVIHGTHFLLGFILSLLGLVNLGQMTYVPDPKTQFALLFDSNAPLDNFPKLNHMNALVDSSGAIPIVFAFYTVAVVGTSLVLRVMHRFTGDVYGERHH